MTVLLKQFCAFSKYYYCIELIYTIGNESLSKAVKHFISKAKKGVPEHTGVGNAYPLSALCNSHAIPGKKELLYKQGPTGALRNPKHLVGIKSDVLHGLTAWALHQFKGKRLDDGPPRMPAPLSSFPAPVVPGTGSFLTLLMYSGQELMQGLRYPLQPILENTESTAEFKKGKRWQREEIIPTPKL